MVDRWYASNVDWWLALLFALAPLGAAAGLIATIAAGQSIAIGITSVAVIAAVYVGLVFPMRYRF